MDADALPVIEEGSTDDPAFVDPSPPQAAARLAFRSAGAANRVRSATSLPGIRSLRRLTLRFGRPAVEEPAPLAPAADPVPPLIEFVAYAEDSLVAGFVRLETDRLSDLLNDHEEYRLVDAVVQGLDQLQAIELREICLARDELLLVHVTGPRGHPGRRQRTRQHPIAVKLGPYEVRGYLHALPGTDPISSFRRRRAMVPLTDAWVEYVAGGVRQRRRVATVVVNRHLADWVVEADDDTIDLPEMPAEAVKGGLLKDFTGQLHVEPPAAG